MNSLIKKTLESTQFGRNYVAGEMLRKVYKMNAGKIRKAVEATTKLAKVSEQLTEQDMQVWEDAWQAAINVENPRRRELYQIYKKTMIDAHLRAAIRNRVSRTLCRKFKVVDDKGKENEELTKLLRQGWFRKFVRLSLMSKFYGYVLVQFGDRTETGFTGVKEVPRHHVVPEKSLLVREPGDDSGFDYTTGQLALWCLGIGDEEDLGLLLEASPHAISKRNQSAFWDEFSEIFGMPMRIAKTATKDKAELSEIEAWLKNMGAAPYGMFPQGTELELKESQSRDAYQVFDKKIDRCNSEMSKLILGVTMTMDDGASYKQGEVHKEMETELIESDGDDMAEIIQDKLFPFLTLHGFGFENMTFTWDDSRELTLKEQKEIDEWLLQYFEIEEDYFRETYNAHITGFRAVPLPAASGGAEGKK